MTDGDKYVKEIRLMWSKKKPCPSDIWTRV
jgi:hypothetical protein